MWLFSALSSSAGILIPQCDQSIPRFQLIRNVTLQIDATPAFSLDANIIVRFADALLAQIVPLCDVQMPVLAYGNQRYVQHVDTPAFNSIDDATHDYSAHSAPTSYTPATQDQMMPPAPGGYEHYAAWSLAPADKPRRPPCPRDALKI